MKKKQRMSYNNGFARVVVEKTRPTSFNGKTNGKTAADYDYVGDIFYSEESRRHEDMLFAESMNRNLTMKIKTGFTEWIKPTQKIIIGKKVLDIIHTDTDLNKRILYIYLEEARELDDTGQNT